MKKYTVIYQYYRELIESGQLSAGSKLPSIRSAAQYHSVSVTTVQNAYFDLQADGYILATPKSGYYVSDRQYVQQEATDVISLTSNIQYDLKSGNADSNSFDITLWQRYIKSALRQKERLLSYGEVQGEADLREALSRYIREKRNVIASPDRIVVGAGINALFAILCPLLPARNSVSFPDESFVLGRTLFSDYGFAVHTRDKNADIIYVSPSHMTSFGDVMPVKRRLELVKHSEQRNSLVIEDDYDSDFLYNTKPMPSLFALSGGRNVVYMGSFSNVLVPGIRISFMVLTEELAKAFQQNKHRFAQTASKTEQIALCQYIRDGHINTQTRKIRRLYTVKAKALLEEMKRQLPEAECLLSDNRLQVKLTAPFCKEPDIFEMNGLSVTVRDISNGEIKLLLSPSAVDIKDIPDIVSLLKCCMQ